MNCTDRARANDFLSLITAWRPDVPHPIPKEQKFKPRCMFQEGKIYKRKNKIINIYNINIKI